MTTLTIKGRLPSLNDYILACRSNKFAGAKFKSDIENGIILQLRSQAKGLSFTTPVKIKFTWVEKNNKRDLDNICSAKKYILDALVKMGVFENDTRKHIVGFEDVFPDADKNNDRIEIEINNNL